MASQPLQPVALHPLIEASAQTEGITLAQLEVPTDLHAQARPDALRRAIGNILRNAHLHAPGPVIISAHSTASHVTLTITDTGPGVPTDSLPRLFDPFYRVDTSRTRDTGGTGLGLAIVKTCLEACQATVTAHNHEPSGLAIVIKLGK